MRSLATAVIVLLALVLAWARIGDQGTAEPAEHLNLAWPREGEAAVAVEGVGSLGASGSGAPVPIASLAKVITAYLVLRDHPLEPGEEGFEIEISQADVEETQQRLALNQSVVAVEAGEVLSERQALVALLLPSANNIAALLAVHEAASRTSSPR